MKFKRAVEQTPNTVTTNGMAAYTTTHDACLDLFSGIGAMRGKDITKLLTAAVKENPNLTLQIMQWARDIRNGSGERKSYRDAIILLFSLEMNKEAEFLIEQAPVIGRWDDAFDDLQHYPKSTQKLVLAGIAGTLRDEGNNSRFLLAKWLPREGKKNDYVFHMLAKHMKLSNKQLRKLLVSLTSVVETQMCDNEWSEINYEHVPSLAAARYQKAFTKHDPEGYKRYRDSLTKGTAKINASAVYPYDIIHAAQASQLWDVAEAQWKAIPLELESKILPICDTSGSMRSLIGGFGSKSQISCYDVSVSLGMFLAERNKGAFQDLTITFSVNPKARILRGSLKDRYREMVRNSEMGNTDLHKAMKLVLKIALDNNVPQEDMPDTLLILSDMQFDRCAEGVGALKMIEKEFQKAGYKMPAIVFWNLNAAYDNKPATKHNTGVALVSGFSPQIVKNLTGIATKTPYEVMLEVVSKYPVPA